MPDNTGKDLKMFYSISEVAEMFDVQPTLLRYWEKHFPQIVPKRLNRTVRQYTQDEINKIRVVYNLVKVRGLKLDAAAKLIKKNRGGEEKKTEVVTLLQDIREELLTIKDKLNQL